MTKRQPGAMGLMMASGEVEDEPIVPADKNDQAPVRDDLTLNFPDEPKKKPRKEKVETKRDTSTMKASDDFVVRMIESEKIKPWKYANRPANEFGKWDEFVRSIASEGVKFPIVVRPDPNNKGQFEEIVGRRRWRAALELGISIPCFIQDLNDQDAAALQQLENDKRDDLSLWADAMYWDKLLKDGVFKSQSALAVHLGRDRRDISDAMAYMRIAKELYDAIAELTLVPLRVAKELASLTKDGANLDKLLPLADKIRENKISSPKLRELCRELPTKQKPRLVRVSNQDSHTIRKDTNGTAVISLRKELLELATLEEISLAISVLHEQKLSVATDKNVREADDFKTPT